MEDAPQSNIETDDRAYRRFDFGTTVLLSEAWGRLEELLEAVDDRKG